MTELHPDVEVYLKKIKNFFEKDKDTYREIFGDHPLEKCIEEIKKESIKTFQKKGEAELTKRQMKLIKQVLDERSGNKTYEVDVTNVFLKMSEDYPPLCWN